MLAALTAHSQEAKMDPRVVYAPDIIGVERLTMVALKVPLAAPEVAVKVPDCLVLLDHTKVPAKSEIRRWYFRSVKPSPGAEIVFAHPEGEIKLPIVVWSFEDLRQQRTLKNALLPRRWPLGKDLPELKESQVVTTDLVRDSLKGRGGPEAWLRMSDEDIWNLQPDSTIPRWHWVNVANGCPVHGTEIYTKKAYYPWGKDTTFPYSWKIKCPVGDELYPSNDFANDDFTSGAFPDDGIGGGYVQDGKHYGFIAEICQIYCHRMLSVAPACANGYLSTGDVRYLHKALVAMSRLAVEHAYLATMTQHRHRNTDRQVQRLGQGRFDEGPFLAHSGLTVYPIDQPDYQRAHADAYDAIFPDIDKDPEIIPFLQSKGFAIKTHEDVRRFLEENLFATWMQAAMDGATHSNEPYHQRGMIRMAEVLNYKQGADFMDWLYDGLGRMRIFVPNTFFKDGSPYESTGGYNGMHVVALGPIIESIERMRERRPEVYPESKYPSLSKSRRYRNVFDFSMDTVTIDRSFPDIGDTGSFPSYRKMSKITWQNGGPEAFEHAYTLLKDPKFAWALAKAPGWKPSATFPYTREQIEREAAKWPDDWNDASSLHDGYGIAILRGGKGDDKRALWMNYGHNRGHSQDDTFDIGLQAYQGILLSHMGYPRNWGYWEYSWSSHYVARSWPYETLVAQPTLFADAGVAHVTEARGSSYVDRSDEGVIELPETNWQRRLLALVDVGPDRFYAVDFYRIFGGEEHWWAFHGQEGEVQTEGVELTRQQGGTLAGPEVPYGDEKWLAANGCSKHPTYGWRGNRFVFPHLYNVDRGSFSGPWSVDWKLKTGDGLHLKLHQPSAEGMQINLADGTSPAGGKPYEMKWVMLSKKGEAPVQSQVVSVLEAYHGEPVIKSQRPLKLTGATDEAEFAAQAVELALADRTDTVLFAADATAARQTETGVQFAGRFGLWAEKDGKPVAMSLVGGTRLMKGELGIELPSGEYRGAITKVDREKEVITITPAPPVPAALVGARIFLHNANRRVAHKVLAAKAVGNDSVELQLDLDSRLGTGKVTGTLDHRVQTDTPFPLHRFRYYHGARLVNNQGAEYRLVEVRNSAAAIIDAAQHPDAKADKLAAEFPTGSWFEVYDYGVGDEVHWPYAVSVTQVSDRVYRITSPVPVTVHLPAGAVATGAAPARK
jgi:hypothetical protein